MDRCSVVGTQQSCSQPEVVQAFLSFTVLVPSNNSVVRFAYEDADTDSPFMNVSCCFGSLLPVAECKKSQIFTVIFCCCCCSPCCTEETHEQGASANER